MQRVAVREAVVGGVPVREFVGATESGDARRRRVGERAAEIDRTGAFLEGRVDGGHDPARIITEQGPRKRRMLAIPGLGPGAARRALGQLRECGFEERDQVDGMAPRIHLLAASRRRDSGDDARQDRSRVLPTDDVQALRRLVHKVQRVAAVGEGAIGRGVQQHPRHPRRRDLGLDRRRQRSLGPVAMADQNPVPEPALERAGVDGRAFQGPPDTARRLPGAIGGHPANAVKQREVGLFGGQVGEQVGERRQHRQPGPPAVAVTGPEPRRLADQARRFDPGCPRPENGLSNHEGDVVLHAVAKFPKPVGRLVRPGALIGDPHLAVRDLDVRRGDVVGPKIECAAAGDVETRVVPVAREDPVFHRSPVKGESPGGGSDSRGHRPRRAPRRQGSASAGPGPRSCP